MNRVECLLFENEQERREYEQWLDRLEDGQQIAYAKEQAAIANSPEQDDEPIDMG